MGDVCGGQPANRGLRDGGVEEELVFGEGLCEMEVFFAARGIEDLLGAGLEGGFELDRMSD